MLPGNISLKVFPPHYILGGSALLFGTFLSAASGARGYGTIISMRVLIGAVQAFIQGLGLYVTIWYRRDEVATRGGMSAPPPPLRRHSGSVEFATGLTDDVSWPAIYYSAATISGAFSGLIAYGIQKNLTLESTGREPWRWLFIIEGAIGLFVGALTLFFLPPFPEQLRGRKHWLLRSQEVELAIERMKCEWIKPPNSMAAIQDCWAVESDVRLCSIQHC